MIEIEIMISDEADEIMKELFGSLEYRHHNNLESMKGSDLVLDYVHLIDHKCHKINPNCGGSYIDCPDWIKNKKGAITPISNKCFQCAAIKL